ncbi:ATP-binding cassette domain-containing protein [Oceanobacillus piezotolerans]|uniref:ATP-binding cassette domain-containing protein n=1 Tax=Oceanobacillus piezotolerans TaxID=2448030 RepID=A0A498D523_9BACI|nr:ATP-binding cassette domain-containing protein [Oceanobacillus piezotolerans]RLL43946.1 ATP-binding cassette domain-containing protein [Oceanobacillus piezotolerans]
MIEFHQVSKVFESNGNKVEALKNINLTVEKGDIFGVIGFSGAGKSTLIRTVNLLEYPTSGKVIVEGKNLAKLSQYEIREAKKDIGMVFQHFNLLNSKTVFHNVAMPLLLSGYNKKAIENQVYETLRFVGLEEKAKNYPDQLSGGQKQRVGIARALTTNPSILLCDEATSALDPETTKSILNLLKRINEEYNITILMITHEMKVIKEICNRVAVMEDGQIIETGNVYNVFAHPKTDTTRNFVKSVIRDEVPKSVYQLFKEKDHFSRIFKIEFFGADSGQPIVSKTAKIYHVEINVLFGNITELQGIPLGNLIVELIGDNYEIRRAIEFIINKDIEVKEVFEDGSEHRVDIERVVGNDLHG